MDRKIEQNGEIEYMCEDGKAIDMNVKPGVKTVHICYNLSMRETEKNFPDVTILKIGEGVEEIDIPNTLFPNVRQVRSKGINFLPSEYLVQYKRLSYGYSGVLLNTFCHSKDKNIVLPLCVNRIGAYAFKDCEAVNLSEVKIGVTCDKNAFTGSGFEKQPFVNGVKMAGNIVIDVDKSASVVDLPDDKVNRLMILPDMSDVEHVITHRESTFFLRRNITFPKRLTLDLDRRMQNVANLCFLLHRKVSDKDFVRGFDISKRTKKLHNLEIFDGVVYSKIQDIDGAPAYNLVCCPMDISDVVVHDNTTRIGMDSFSSCWALKSVKIPDSTRLIDTGAFKKCVSLKDVDFGNGLIQISPDAFYGCKNLKHVTFPKSINSIWENAFAFTGIQNIRFPEGMEFISSNVFMHSALSEVYIPKTLDAIKYEPFGENIKKVVLEKYNPKYIRAVMTTFPSDDMAMMPIEVVCNGKKAYLPRKKPAKHVEDMVKEVTSFFESDVAYVSTFSFASSVACRNIMAFNEYMVFGNDEAKEHVKKNSKNIAYLLMEQGKEEDAVRLLKTGFVSKVTLKKLLNMAEEKDMPVVKAYVLQIIGDNSRKISLSI